MITNNHRIRFAENNQISATNWTYYSSSHDQFQFTNLFKEERSKVWRPSGAFKIDSTNDKIYFFDLTPRTATIDQGVYASPTLLAAEIQSKMNAVSSGFTCTYESSFKFKISRATNFVLALSNQTNSLMPTIGITSPDNTPAITSILSDNVTIHTSEWATFDFGFAFDVSFIAIVGNVDEIFTLSPTAIIKVYANNLNDFENPAFERTLTRYDSGVFNFIDDVDSSYRYWKIEIIDKHNPLGPEGLVIANLYLGDYQTLQSRNIENGFTQTMNDKSEKFEAQSGSLFFNKRPKFRTYDSMSLGFIEEEDRMMFEEMFQKLGLSTPFYISIDPRSNFTTGLNQLTRLVTFNSEPQIRHVIRDIFTISLSLRESV